LKPVGLMARCPVYGRRGNEAEGKAEHVPEGMSAEEVGKEIAHHAAEHGRGEEHDGRDRILSIAEAVLLSIVALIAAWSGYAAKWSSESRVSR
jgi:hypothetical protein